MSRGIVLPDSAKAAAVPAASPITKQAPRDARAGLPLAVVIEAQRAGHQQVVHAVGYQHAVRQLGCTKPRLVRNRRPLEYHVARARSASFGQPLTPIVSSNEAQPSTSSPVSM